MSNITITEALAEIKTIDARIAKKSEFIGANLLRQEILRDPLEKDGGSRVVITRERQSIKDLLERKLQLRDGIQVVNTRTMLKISTVERSVAEWLCWRRDVAPIQRNILESLWNGIQNARRQAPNKGASVLNPGEAAQRPTDIVVNIDERELAQERESLEEMLGKLDGQLSLLNATVLISLAE